MLGAPHNKPRPLPATSLLIHLSNPSHRATWPKHRKFWLAFWEWPVRLSDWTQDVLRFFVVSFTPSRPPSRQRLEADPYCLPPHSLQIHYSLIVLPIVAKQPTLFVHGFVHRGFAYSCKNYHGSPHASRWRSSLIRDSTCVTSHLIHNRPHPLACFTQPLPRYNGIFYIFHPFT